MAERRLQRHDLRQHPGGDWRQRDLELEKIERFGKNVERAVFRLDGKNRSATLAVLLVTAKAGTLRWAGPN